MAIDLRGRSSVSFYDTFSAFPPVGSTTVLYVDRGDMVVYIWNGSSYDQLNNGSNITTVENYAALLAIGASNVPNSFYWCSSSQGTSWLPGPLGGTYYNSGLYYSNGTTWEYMNSPYQATQAEVNAGIVGDKFVTPSTLYNSTQWSANPITIGTTPITSGVAGRVLFEGSGNVVQEDAGLFWDNVNKRLGVGTSAPSALLQINGSVSASSAIARGGLIAPTLTASANNDVLVGLDIAPTYVNGGFSVRQYALRVNGAIIPSSDSIISLGTNNIRFQSVNTRSVLCVGNSLDINASNINFNDGIGAVKVRLIGTSGNLLIGTSTDSGAKLHITAQGALSTDIAFRIRNSADTLDIIRANGAGEVFVGLGAGRISTGANNSFFGLNAGYNNTTGNNNTAIGYAALFSNTTGFTNTANGYAALYANTTGASNIAQGFNSGRFIADGTTANAITNNSVYIGNNTKALANNQTNQIVIGYEATGLGSNTAVLGNDSITLTGLKGNVAIGATTASAKLDVRAQGALSTDVAFRVRNSADTRNVVEVLGSETLKLNAKDTTLGNRSFIIRNSANTEDSVYYDNAGWLTVKRGTSTTTLSNTGTAVGADIEINSPNSQLIKFTGSIDEQIQFNLASGGVGAISFNGGLVSRINATSSAGLTIGYYSVQKLIMAIYEGGNLSIGYSTDACTANNQAGTKVLALSSGTAPTTSYVDAFKMYSADITAGNAAPHFRTENGNIIKLYQETTAVAASTLVNNLGVPLTDTDTFDGYTLKQVVKALKNLGILA